MSTLSVIIITKNEQQNIVDCLKSVQFADEIIVLDSQSTDQTVELAKQYTDLVEVTDWPGDGPQKNRALKKACKDWILCLDADERVSPELAKQIQQVIKTNDFAGYHIPYTSTYCSKPIRFGDWRNESHLRLFQRKLGTFSDDVVHCHAKISGKTSKLNYPIIHHPFHHLHAMLVKLNEYSSESSKNHHQRGRRANLFTAISHGLWTFIRGYFIKLGFLDGKEGFLLAVSNAEGTYYRYLKLMYLCENNKAKRALV